MKRHRPTNADQAATKNAQRAPLRDIRSILRPRPNPPRLQLKPKSKPKPMPFTVPSSTTPTPVAATGISPTPTAISTPSAGATTSTIVSPSSSSAHAKSKHRDPPTLRVPTPKRQKGHNLSSQSEAEAPGLLTPVEPTSSHSETQTPPYAQDRLQSKLEHLPPTVRDNPSKRRKALDLADSNRANKSNTIIGDANSSRDKVKAKVKSWIKGNRGRKRPVASMQCSLRGGTGGAEVDPNGLEVPEIPDVRDEWVEDRQQEEGHMQQAVSLTSHHNILALSHGSVAPTPPTQHNDDTGYTEHTEQPEQPEYTQYTQRAISTGSDYQSPAPLSSTTSPARAPSPAHTTSPAPTPLPARTVEAPPTSEYTPTPEYAPTPELTSDSEPTPSGRSPTPGRSPAADRSPTPGPIEALTPPQSPQAPRYWHLALPTFVPPIPSRQQDVPSPAAPLNEHAPVPESQAESVILTVTETLTRTQNARANEATLEQGPSELDQGMYQFHSPHMEVGIDSQESEDFDEDSEATDTQVSDLARHILVMLTPAPGTKFWITAEMAEQAACWPGWGEVKDRYGVWEMDEERAEIERQMLEDLEEGDWPDSTPEGEDMPTAPHVESVTQVAGVVVISEDVLSSIFQDGPAVFADTIKELDEEIAAENSQATI
ncbi:hypothetical protein CcaverHIS002_0503170 [Cutaneotrichosporon cavernicola]|uniref:Uncharacterized protein n=1 Tax=Cutaneotrichosporon cavernicola TaxID=279322 RepID=A0AA48QWV8_9TREE|nr:uncharacterized protein CcaverHIS019_0503740 [Cutaneotrichosporon cavernicola]BEI84916.1 hypothetical protein CcaverHIS002_0503170 [Cutaneotrichosporon cavernicola]BEI92746.1 hypothetical protein CcaverHIS019_0503740 [Cutaneotrichosporon cavernicola]BEJ00523.1 hypothetical protein CcaverHIS631_0503800 [Cutaneotrichosporon cavernicola]BEJ08292.1 hypothetical protein CcaverHIS641_0503770 [Cutaneotrichosporon cavernicola]